MLHEKRLPDFSGSLDFISFVIDYSIIVATLPEPTVRPPSRIRGGLFLYNSYTEQYNLKAVLFLYHSDFFSFYIFVVKVSSAC